MKFTDAVKAKHIIGSFYNDLEFSDKSVVITPILESEFSKEIRIAFKEGQLMKEHKSKFPITVMTLKGSIEFHVGDELFILDAGEMIALEGNILHELKATQKSVVRLSLHKRDSLKRVQSVLTL